MQFEQLFEHLPFLAGVQNDADAPSVGGLQIGVSLRGTGRITTDGVRPIVFVESEILTAYHRQRR